MPLIVETGTGVANANSYVDLIEGRALADSCGLVLPADDTACEIALAAAARYLEGFADRFQGYATNGLDQPLQWPRARVFVGAFESASDSIPNLLKSAQVAAASLIAGGEDLFPNSDGRFKKASKVDVIESEFSEKVFGTVDGLPRFGIVDTFLRPLLVAAKPVSRLTRF
jgi:hypothetical protein